MTDLSSWLLEQIAADQAVAEAAMTVIGDDLTTYQIGEWWEKPEHGRVYAGHWHRVVDGGGPAGRRDFANTAALAHIAANDPATTLARCKAYRTIVELHKPSPEFDHQACVLCQWDVDCESPKHVHQYYGDERTDWPCETVLALASVYADRPGYDPEWRLA
jgi:hypothetical protein